MKIPTIDSYQAMPSRKIETGTSISNLKQDKQNLSALNIHRKKRLMGLVNFVETSNSNAFLILKDGELIFEWYDEENFDEQQIHTSFSLAKSITSALVGIAIEEGKIKSVQDEVLTYLPHLDSLEFKGLKIIHLLQMTAGIRHSELDVFYTTDAASIFTDKKLKFRPSKKHEYWSVATQLLGLVLQQAIAPQSISTYLSEKIWQPMGAEHTAYWSVDYSDGIEKTFCCIQASARDYARFGLLYLNKGFFNNQQIVPKQWIEESIAINTEDGSAKHYNYGWWFPSENIEEYMARGFRGQHIFINQSKNTVIVRLGKNRSGLYGFKWSKIFSEINKELGITD